MTPRTFVELFEPTPHLTVKYAPADRMPWQLRTETGQLYARASTFPQAVSFLEAGERKGDVTVDWENVARLRALASSLEVVGGLWSVRADALSEGDDRTAAGRRTSESASNVLPLRRMSEPIDEVG